MATVGVETLARRRVRREGARIYMLVAASIGFLVVAVVAVLAAESLASEVPEILVWAVAAFLADALVVRVTSSATLSMSLPVTVGAALVLSPPAAALAAMAGTWSRATGSTRDTLVASFNRAQVALATLAGSFLASSLGADPGIWPEILGISSVVLLADATVNAVLMVPFVCLSDGVGPMRATRGLFGSHPGTNGLLCASAALMAPILAMSFVVAGPLGVASAFVGVLLGGQALVLAQRTADLHESIASKNAALRVANERLVNERKDERTSLAGDLHDDVLPALFKVHLMGQVVRHDLASGRLLELEEDVSSLLEATEVAQASVRAVVGGLRSSSMGPDGLAGAVRRVADQLAALSAPKIHLDIPGLDATDRSMLVAFQVVREAMNNAAKYSKAAVIEVIVRREVGMLRCMIRDDGCGFDPSLQHDGHFGLLLMRERVEAAGGSFDLQTRLGEGVLVSAQVPADL